MKKWFTSLNGTITLSILALLVFLGRTMLDWRYEFPAFDPTGSMDTSMALTFLVLVGIWLWGLVVTTRGNRRGLIAILAMVLLLDVVFALSTYFFLCPPWTGCVGWPNAWPWNWSQLLLGLLSAFAIVYQLRQNRAERLPV